MKTDDKIIIKRRGDDGYRVFSVAFVKMWLKK